MIDLGQTYRSTLTVTDATGTAANAVTVTLTITLPDATTVTPAVTNPPATTGTYICDYVTTQAGLHKFAWATTSPGAATTDYVNVRDFISIISLADAKAHLDISVTTDDDELRNFLMAATELIEAKTGPCVQRSFTDRVGSYGEISTGLVLNQRPVISVQTVTSVWTGSPSWTTAQLVVDTQAGIVQQVNLFPFWWGPWDVVFTAGRAVIPERFQHAAKEQVRHLWETQRGSAQAPPLAGEETFSTAAGWSFSVPRRVLELIGDDMVPSL